MLNTPNCAINLVFILWPRPPRGPSYLPVVAVHGAAEAVEAHRAVISVEVQAWKGARSENDRIGA